MAGLAMADGALTALDVAADAAALAQRMALWPVALQLLVAALLVTGGAFMLIASIGLLRLGDFFMRLHAPTLAATLGVGSLLLASMAVAAAAGRFGGHELLITLRVFSTVPVSSSQLAAIHLRLRSQAPDGPPPD